MCACFGLPLSFGDTTFGRGWDRAHAITLCHKVIPAKPFPAYACPERAAHLLLSLTEQRK